jgi:hypothetical protein
MDLIAMTIKLILFLAGMKATTMNIIKIMALIMIHMEAIMMAMEVTTILMGIIMTDMESIQNL